MKTNNRGRPPIAAHLKASELIPGFRVTKDQEKRYKAAAKAADVSMAAWIRSVLDQHS